MSDIDYKEIESDSDDIDTLADLAASGLTRIDWFLLVIIAISFLFVISDVYINQLLIKIPDAVIHNEPSAWGSLIQMATQLFLVISSVAIKSYW